MTTRCAYCDGKLPLGVRFRNIWNGLAWIHVRFCSAKCERRYEQKKRISNYQDRWLSFSATVGNPHVKPGSKTRRSKKRPQEAAWRCCALVVPTLQR